MRIFAVNSSPRTGGESKTEVMLDHLVEGMRDAGAEVDVVNLREKKINHCIGCFTCWSRTPGTCVHKDDMTTDLFPRWLAADLAVFASPLYYHTVNGAMSIFRERTLPAIQPFFETDNKGRLFHPLRDRVPPAVWLSVCGLPHDTEFDALSDYLNRTRHKDVSIVAEIYRPAAETLMNPVFADKAGDILDATRQAGRELVDTMAVSAATMERIRQPIVDPQQFARMGDLFWKTCIAEGVTPKTFHEKKMVPRPDSLDSFMAIFPHGLNADAAGDRTVVLQFNFSGHVADSCYFSISADGIDPRRGPHETPDLTIETPFDLWMDIMTGKADGQQLFMEQQYRVTGDFPLMLQLLTGS